MIGGRRGETQNCYGLTSYGQVVLQILQNYSRMPIARMPGVKTKQIDHTTDSHTIVDKAIRFEQITTVSLDYRLVEGARSRDTEWDKIQTLPHLVIPGTGLTPPRRRPARHRRTERSHPTRTPAHTADPAEINIIMRSKILSSIDFSMRNWERFQILSKLLSPDHRTVVILL